ncbi:MAG: bifunctional UDP-3-O-[3-hydroxymyristoyl] N-acetylglucosamine deacetylase/3-hydroxyacyl-ACP dehydratase [Candidatus Marinimicrobia bacterium]|jgi:UDP-3-O-[3-hydroxymyristoyl] N-acetylglucosamine deacetylase/3-hydroxyacyl-[acyl-carrier-protein] dehydratase|nr:bifunctional UDP-3-O-[3-hydroxymyristoyl] N-acetylglucosamine deacetylase/3-hydroxyacyl-ACP dehydratase [Candidatus Neomarinimicrobiota bacterium]MBT3675180.1 bifunctional UDP-3-O-[3-hydroxymyristoyl] N-acetylglucosamine deacetylase/3-hydroxyacyl-ACP dehydratase [Candidatus Neomarinimicrobiota bacterium]MBT3763890.1 bifunctional UDP-3-O-[3-hydroxymyristoyl] N-acetylglucosamine deacetylase/3-hydroxyacyl-ACP dehydratase [Candidatus Neomarinimicrobiota bacterium]MBT4068019.1 bifunctional UDP-3-O
MTPIKYQRTIGKEASCVGVGLHTGVETKITFKPAPDDFGIRFKRMDVDGCPEIRADIDHVVDISRGTTIEENCVRIHTVEHALAACVGIGLDNVLIELTAKEPPVMDGSALDFVKVLLKAGIVKQNATRNYLHIDESVGYSDPERGVDIHIMPSDQFRITFMIDYKFRSLGTQFTTMDELEKNFAEKIAPARTFCFLSEVETLKENGLIQGGNLDNAVVIVDKEIDQAEADNLRNLFGIKQEISLGANGLLNGKKLRFENEPVRHKALDLIGDLALLGMPLQGHVIASKSGHAANVELVKRIKKVYEKKIQQQRFKKSSVSNYIYDINSILKLLPHRYPFVLVDRIVDITPGEKLTAYKNVTINEPFFQGHFPTQPVMPGVLVLEAMAQAGAFLVLNSIDDPMKKNMFFSALSEAKFRHPIIPGDQLRLEMKLAKFKLGTALFEGKGYVGEKLVAEGKLRATVVDRAGA